MASKPFVLFLVAFMSFQTIYSVPQLIRQNTQSSRCPNSPQNCNECRSRAVVMYCHENAPCTSPNTICCESSCCVTSCVAYNPLQNQGFGGRGNQGFFGGRGK